MREIVFRALTGAVGVVVVASVVSLRFCGAVTLPEKPPRPEISAASTQALFDRSAQSHAVWFEAIKRDATAVGLPVPTEAELVKRIPYQASEQPLELQIGAPAVQHAGLWLAAVKGQEAGEPVLMLTLENRGDRDVAYRVNVASNASAYVCNNTPIAAHNTFLITARNQELRTVCAYRDGSFVIVEKIETMTLGELGSYYLRKLGAEQVGLIGKLAKSHRAPGNIAPTCNEAPSAAIRSGVESGKIAWRSLIDFYTRHSCERYRFPITYQHFSKDEEQPLPAAESSL